MTRSILCAWFLCCGAAFGQQACEKIAFEVASIKPAAAMPMGMMRSNMNADAGMLRFTNVSLKDCIRVAYRVKDFQVEGPDWMSGARFDITAKLPAGASRDQIPEMLQALLADRFQLQAHRDTKEHAVYALVAAKSGPKLKAAEVATGEGAAAPKPDRSGLPGGRMMMQMSPGGMHLKAPAATLGSLAEMLSRFTERPVVDLTGIQGQYDFELTFVPETTHGMPAGMRGPGPGPGGERPEADASREAPPSIPEAVQAYGLKLETRKAPVEIVIVDHVEKQASEN